VTIPLTIVLPFFNEEGWIGATVASLAAQSDQRFRLLMVDNGSNDAGALEAARNAEPMQDRATVIQCPTPGKMHAINAGLALVETPLVATCDADTHYPPDYVKRLISLFESDPNAASVMAIDLYAPETDASSLKRSAFVMRKSRRFPRKCHAGGYAQAFRTSALRAAGGFDLNIWPYVLEDHEIVHRLIPHGHIRYHADHVCFPSERRVSREAVSWNRTERLLYRYMPRWGMNWYFYRFLGPRFARRKSFSIALREKQWCAPAA
jgi:glycosyltransferase involved in cell wall biosynthesis